MDEREAYSSNGNATVVNGNGSFKTEFSTNKQCDKYEATGQLVNGKKDGKWIFSNPHAALPIATEIYENGIFIKGNSNDYQYTENPKIGFTNYYANENLNLLENMLGCPGNSILDFRYNNETLHESFYPNLQQKLLDYSLPIQNQWLVVGIKISKKDKIDEINVASSINDKNIESYIYGLISKMTLW